MARDRLELHAELKTLPDVREVYFQPPPSLKLVYPCIVYSRDPDRVEKGDNLNYVITPRYTVTIIDPDPDTLIRDIFIRKFGTATPDRNYTSDNLNHYTFTLNW